MAIEQAHGIPIVADGVIWLSQGHGHIIFGYLEAFLPRFFACTWSMTLFIYRKLTIFSQKTNGWFGSEYV
jgi:hypothetical protein